MKQLFDSVRSIVANDGFRGANWGEQARLGIIIEPHGAFHQSTAPWFASKDAGERSTPYLRFGHH